MIASNVNKISYQILSPTPIGGGYIIPYKFWDDSELTALLTSSDGIESVIDPQEYVITKQVDDGLITFDQGYSFPPDAVVLTIYRTIPLSQETDLRDGDILSAEVLEMMFDRHVAQTQQLNERVRRALLIPISDPDSSLEMPSVQIRKGMLLGFDENGDLITVLQTDIEQKLSQALAAENSVLSMYNDAGMVAVRTDMAVPATSKILAVAANRTNIDTVADDIANVNIVGGDIANVNAVAGNKTNIDAVNANKPNIDAVASNETNINAVAANKTNIDKVAANESDITKVALNEADIDVVAADLNLEAASKIKIVAEDKANIDAVAANKSNIDAVAANKSNIDAVAGNEVNIDAVAGNETNINAVNANKPNIDAVASNIEAVQDAHANMDAILDAPAQAAAANQARIDAQAALADMRDRYLGPYPSNPTTDVDGSALEAGDQYYNTVTKLMMVYTGTSWKAAAADAQNVGYDGTTSGIEADNIQGALDELSSEKENTSNKKSTLVENSEIYYPTQKAVNLGLNRTMAEMMGFAPRNLMDVFGTLTVPATFEALRDYLTASGGCDFSLLRLGDYIDLDSFTVNNWYNGAAYNSTTGAWDTTVTVTKNLSYENTRVEIVGFSDYRYVGNTAYPSTPHVTFQFKNLPLTAPMHKLNVSPFYQTSQNYKGSDLVTIGLANFYAGLADNFGIGTANETIPYSVDRIVGTVSDWEWCGPEKLFLPTGMNIFGHPGFAQEHHGVGTQSQFPLYALNTNSRMKKFNGSLRQSWWLAEPSAGSSSNFTAVYSSGALGDSYSCYSLGVAPAFLI